MSARLGSKYCRYPLLPILCFVEFARLVCGRMVNTRLKKFLILLLILAAMIFCMKILEKDIHMKGKYSKWVPSLNIRRIRPSKVFVHGAYDDIFIYSAIANDRQPQNNDLNVVITSLDRTYATFQCCFILNNKTIYTTPAQEYFSHFVDKKNGFMEKLTKHYDPGIYRAHQHSCFLPDTGHHAPHVTLTSSKCSSDIADYVPVSYQTKAHGKIALCAKIAHSGGIDPEKFIEWVEIQRIQGVDKILIFNLGNPEPLMRVMRYYRDLGLLDVQPYELPGSPKRRTLQEKDKYTTQFSHDETLTVLECRQRIGGYTYVLSHDVDEFIIPRKDVDLKTFLSEKMENYVDAAGFFFYAEFFIYDWKPTHADEDLMVTRYRKTTVPHWECTKYIYLPSRVRTTVTHDMYPHKSFQKYRIPPEEAILHHYRQCPDVWRTCHPPTIIDDIMTRFTLRHNLYARVKKVREATNIKPRWVIK